MIKFFVGFVVGVVLSSTVLLIYVDQQATKKFELGSYHGEIHGLSKAARLLSDEFGDLDSSLSYEVLYSVKTTSVVSTEINGVKTIRVIP